MLVSNRLAKIVCILSLSVALGQTVSTFVHVAKCGGTSVQASLWSSNISMNSENQRGCSSSNQVCQVHYRSVTREDVDGKKVFILTRDPTARFISALNWRRHETGLKGFQSSREKQLFRCFAHPRELVAALSNRTECGMLARGSFRPEAAYSHVSMGFEYYLHGVIGLLTSSSQLNSDGTLYRQYKLVRNEHLEEDMRHVRAWAGLPPPAGLMPSLFSTYPGKERADLTADEMSIIKQHLEPDYVMLERLRAYASVSSPDKH
mmetsp:Transcript_6775/g.17575  ORF Transcript_6775/g.17575 Transcript_6775/m.17575 type:complete len:262 (-) Transcript_6775:233-1018(-)